MTLNKESQPVAWLLQRLYKPPKGSALARMGSEPLLSAYLLRRFAALRSMSPAHVTGLASFARATSWCGIRPQQELLPVGRAE
jgi:hypothetical protein